METSLEVDAGEATAPMEENVPGPQLLQEYFEKRSKDTGPGLQIIT